MANERLLGKNGAVGAGRIGSEEAGLRMLKSGGNAVDAGVASILALSVTDHDLFCFGGEVPIILYMSDTKKVNVINGQGPAPMKANLEMFIGTNAIPGNGILPAAIPSVLSTCLLALDKFGTKTFGEVAEPTMGILTQNGQPWFIRLAKTLDRLMTVESSENANSRSAGLEAVHRYFYEGPIANELVMWNQSMGGLFSNEDFRNYRAKLEEPIHGTYRGYDVYKCGFWTQGPALIQSLNILEGFDLGSMKPDDPEFIHIVIESLKLAFGDRDTYYGDPDFAKIPMEELLSKDYAATRRALIDLKKASLKHQPGDPEKNKAIKYNFDKPDGMVAISQDTTTCVAGDKYGNMFVATPSGWGSGLQPGGTGIVLGTRLQSFNIWPGHPNVLQPGKRPRITLTPTLIMKDKKPFMVISVAGGDQQDQTALQMLIKVIDFGMAPQEAADSTRFGTNHLIGSFRQTPVEPGSLIIEGTAPEGTINALKDKGHNITINNVSSNTVMIVWQADGSLEIGGDLGKGKSIAAI